MKRSQVAAVIAPHLTVQEMQEDLKRLTYKAGWEFELYAGRHEGTHLVIRFPVEDSYEPGKTILLDVHTFVPPIERHQLFYDWVLDRIKRIEVHEAREFFKIDGDVWDDPHAEFADRDL